MYTNSLLIDWIVEVLGIERVSSVDLIECVNDMVTVMISAVIEIGYRL